MCHIGSSGCYGLTALEGEEDYCPPARNSAKLSLEVSFSGPSHVPGQPPSPRRQGEPRGPESSMSPDSPLLPEGRANHESPSPEHAHREDRVRLRTAPFSQKAGQTQRHRASTAMRQLCPKQRARPGSPVSQQARRSTGAACGESGPSPAPSQHGQLGLRCVSGRPPSPRRQGRQWHEPDPCPSRGPIVFGTPSSQEPHSGRADHGHLCEERAGRPCSSGRTILPHRKERKTTHYRPEKSTITIQQDNGDRSAAPTACRSSSSSFTTTPHEGTELVKHAFYCSPSGPTWHDPHLSGEVRVLRRP